MARKKTREELEREIARLQAAEEALYALTQGVRHAGYWGPVVLMLTSGEGETFVSLEIVGVERAAGGVIVCMNGESCCPVYVSDWCQTVESRGLAADPYTRDLVNKARKAQAEAVRARGVKPYTEVAETTADRVWPYVDTAYQELVAAREYVMGPEVRDHTNKAIRNLAWALRVHLGVAVRASDDPSGNGGASKEVRP